MILGKTSPENLMKRLFLQIELQDICFATSFEKFGRNKEELNAVDLIDLFITAIPFVMDCPIALVVLLDSYASSKDER